MGNFEDLSDSVSNMSCDEKNKLNSILDIIIGIRNMNLEELKTFRENAIKNNLPESIIDIIDSEIQVKNMAEELKTMPLQELKKLRENAMKDNWPKSKIDLIDFAINGRNVAKLSSRESELSSLEAEEKTITEAEALIEKQNEKEGQDIGEN